MFHDESNGTLDDTGALHDTILALGELLVPNHTVAGTTTTVDTVTMNAAERNGFSKVLRLVLMKLH